VGCGFVSHSTFVEVVCVVFFLIYLLSMLHYKIVILHAGIHLCFFSVIGDAVTVSVSEFSLQLLLYLCVCVCVFFFIDDNSMSHYIEYYMLCVHCI